MWSFSSEYELIGVFGSIESGSIGSIGTIVYKAEKCKDYTVSPPPMERTYNSAYNDILDGLYESELTSVENVIDDTKELINRIGAITLIIAAAILVVSIVILCQVCKVCCRSNCCRDRCCLICHKKAVVNAKI